MKYLEAGKGSGLALRHPTTNAEYHVGHFTLSTSQPSCVNFQLKSHVDDKTGESTIANTVMLLALYVTSAWIRILPDVSA